MLFIFKLSHWTSMCLNMLMLPVCVRTIAGSIPAGFANLASLVDLCLQKNNLTGDHSIDQRT